MYKFHENEDSILIEYKLVEDLKDMILPELSFCLRDPFFNDSLASLGLTKDDYHNLGLNLLENDLRKPFPPQY